MSRQAGPVSLTLAQAWANQGPGAGWGPFSFLIRAVKPFQMTSLIKKKRTHRHAGDLKKCSNFPFAGCYDRHSLTTLDRDANDDKDARGNVETSQSSDAGQTV